MNKNCLSYWFPNIAPFVPVPETIIIRTGVQLRELCDGETVPDGFDDFISQLENAARQIGFPCFLRTGQGSGKHNWEKTCHINRASDIPSHVMALIEWSETVDMTGLPYDVWAIREMLPVQPAFHCVRYGNMPVVREFRAFTERRLVKCIHPYWPIEACEKGIPSDTNWRDSLALHHEIPFALATKLRHIAELVADAVSADDWSIDMLETTRGWYVTDMALAKQSYHWPSCDRSPQFGEHLD